MVYDTETLSIDRILRNIFIEKSCKKCAPKDSPRPLFHFDKQLKIAIACNKFL